MMSRTGGVSITESEPPDTYQFLDEFDLFSTSNLGMLNFLVARYYTLHPIVGNAIDLHVDICYSDLEIGGVDGEVKAAYEELFEDLDLVNQSYIWLLSYFLFGESVNIGRWDEEKSCWSEILWVPTEKVFIIEEKDKDDSNKLRRKYQFDRSGLDSVELLVGSTYRGYSDYYMNPFFVRSMFGTTSPRDWEPVDEFYVMHMSREIPWTLFKNRGVSMVLRVLRDLMYEENLLRANMKIARDRLSAPDLWKIGDPTSPEGWMPDASELADWRQTMRKAQADPNYEVFTHPFVTYENYGANSRLLPITPEIERLEERIANGLWTNREGMSGRGTSYGAATVDQQIREHRYGTHRGRLYLMIIADILKPVALARDYYMDSTAASKGKIKIGNRIKLMLPDFRRLLGGRRATKTFEEKRKKLALPDLLPKSRIRLQDSTDKVQTLMRMRDSDKTYIPDELILKEIGFTMKEVKDAQDKAQGSNQDPLVWARRKGESQVPGGGEMFPMPTPRGPVGPGPGPPPGVPGEPIFPRAPAGEGEEAEAITPPAPPGGE